MFKRLMAIFFVAVAAPSVAMAQATGPSFTALTDNVTFESVQDAVLSVGALAIGLTLVVLGIRYIMRMIRGA